MKPWMYIVIFVLLVATFYMVVLQDPLNIIYPAIGTFKKRFSTPIAPVVAA